MNETELQDRATKSQARFISLTRLMAECKVRGVTPIEMNELLSLFPKKEDKVKQDDFNERLNNIYQKADLRRDSSRILHALTTTFLGTLLLPCSYASHVGHYHKLTTALIGFSSLAYVYAYIKFHRIGEPPFNESFRVRKECLKIYKAIDKNFNPLEKVNGLS